MKQAISRKQSSRRTGSEVSASAVPDINPSDFCSVCRLIFGSHESRIFVGEKVAHSRCARWLSKPRAA